VVLGIMPETAETDLGKVKTWIKDQIKREGLTWGESKEEDIAYGIKKLILGCVIEDKVSIEEIIEKV
jgi:translation elongation factor EF-1beta